MEVENLKAQKRKEEIDRLKFQNRLKREIHLCAVCSITNQEAHCGIGL